jgi:hypothetical protein
MLLMFLPTIIFEGMFELNLRVEFFILSVAGTPAVGLLVLILC